MKTFAELGVKANFIKGLEGLSIYKPTEIQERVLPILLSHKTDIVGQAQTGTGKTVAFGIPLLHNINPNVKEVQGLILCPTRELAKQVEKQLFRFTKYTERIFTEAIYGGVKIEQQIKALSRPTHIIVATPGRLIDLIHQEAVDLSTVKTVILDEADEMLSLGFEKQLYQILNQLTSVESHWLFSATMPDGIQTIISKYIDADAPNIKVNPAKVVNTKIIHQHYFTNNKYGSLRRFLKLNANKRGIVFCKTRMTTGQVSQRLLDDGISAAAIHGNMSQRDREKILRMFRKKSIHYLVGTDVIARGIDIEQLDFVVHFQLPENEEYYTHRSGRTARAGESGISLSLLTKNEKHAFNQMLQNLKLKSKEIHSIKILNRNITITKKLL